jgi:hypothetical protein
VFSIPLRDPAQSSVVAALEQTITDAQDIGAALAKKKQYLRIVSLTHFSSFGPRRPPHSRFDMADQPLQVKLMSQDARPPVRATPHSAGYDLFAAQEAIIDSRTHALVKTDIAIALAPHTYGRIAPRSGLALKHGIHVMAGVID